VPDGRTRLKTLACKHLIMPKYQQIAPRVKDLYDQGILVRQIGIDVGCDCVTALKSLRWWHESRGLPAPEDGRTRRKHLEVKGRPRLQREPEELMPNLDV